MENRNAGNAFHIKQFMVKAGIVLLLLILLYLQREIVHVFLIVFAGILLAVFLDGMAKFLALKTGLSRKLALGLGVILLIVFLAVAEQIAGARLVNQFVQLTKRIPEAFESIRTNLSHSRWGQKLLAAMQKPRQILPLGPDVLQRITGIFSSALGVIGSILVIAFIGIYLSVNPDVYIKNIVRLFPVTRQQSVREVFKALGHALRWWLVGRIASMFVVGALTAMALAIFGIPLALTLGLIAALLSFVPYLGPVASAVPAVLVGLGESPITAVYVIIIFMVVQFLESYLITPLIQRRAVSIPPALLLTVQILMGVLAGALGIFLATPLAVVVIVLIQILYVRDVLGDSPKILGEH